MPVKLTPLESLLTKLNVLPVPLMEEWLYMWSARSLLVAQELEVFNSFDKPWLTGPEIAKKIGASDRAIGHLLDTLVSLGYLKKDSEGHYANTRRSEKWLVSASPHYIGDWRYITEMLWHRSENLADVVRTGRVKESGWEFLNSNPEWWPKIESSWKSLASLASPTIASKVKLPLTPRKLIDIGGGHGLHSVAFCRKYPSLTATIFDWPNGIKSARATVESAGMQKRIQFHEGNFMVDELGTGYDVALLFNIIHGNGPKDNIFLLKKTADALNKNGTVLILDQIRGPNRSKLSSLVAETTGLNLFLWAEGKTYTFEEVHSWLEDAGFASVREKKGRTGTSLISGTKS